MEQESIYAWLLYQKEKSSNEKALQAHDCNQSQKSQRLRSNKHFHTQPEGNICNRKCGIENSLSLSLSLPPSRVSISLVQPIQPPPMQA